ncbi:MAG: hypothetical protein ABIY51_04360 [Ferruginibacter sp.]
MKQITICMMLLMLSINTFCQQTTLAQPVAKNSYLLKSKHQATTALILAGSALFLIVSGAVAYKYGNSGLILMGAGLLSGIASIPFVISSVVNRNKAKRASLSLGLESNSVLLSTHIAIFLKPEIVLKLNL